MKDEEPWVNTVILNASNRGDALDAILVHMVEEGMLPLEVVAEIRHGLDRRHELGSPSLGDGIAVPHLRHTCADRPLMTLALLKHLNTDWESIDGEPVDLVFLIVFPYDPLMDLACPPRNASRRYFERLWRLLRARIGDRLRPCGTAEELAEVLRDSQDERS